MHNPAKFFIRIEFKDSHADEIKSKGWSAWERNRRAGEEPIEVLVGGRSQDFLDLIRFERAAEGLDAGNPQLLAVLDSRHRAKEGGTYAFLDALRGT
jgi:hypothetical protein